MERRRLETSLYAGVLFAALGVVAWVSGQPFIFPSLGPSAFILAFERTGEHTWPGWVIGSHVVALVAIHRSVFVLVQTVFDEGQTRSPEG